MSSALPNPVDCCQTTCDTEVQTIPGPQGPAGADGADGSNGQNAFTTLTAGFTQPSVGGDVTVNVVSSSWATPTQDVYVGTAGYMRVQSKPSSTQIVLRNLGYTGNAAPAAAIPNGSSISPAGIKGDTGATGSSDFDAIAPTSSKGETIVHDGTDNIALAPGTNGTVLKAASGETAGVAWEKIDLSDSAEVENALPVANGGTGATDAPTAAANLAVVKVAGDTMTGNLDINKSLPRLGFRHTGAALDEKQWYYSISAQEFSIQIANDAGSAFVKALSVTRSGATITEVRIPNSDFIIDKDILVIGRLKVQRQNNAVLVNGDNHNVALGTPGYVKIDVGPTAAFALTGITGGEDGAILILQNGTGQVGTLKHQNAGSTALNRIVTDTAADAAFTLAVLIYDSEDQLWYVVQRW